ncbi:uncharacterized protein LOC6638936 isoform X1 [Drosophila willistoni]|uniref:uncharacterized protein LOC6638936 isoform X1 n=1 Tax=Drosophila willistoni TaxID=7260 RepID=UPI000C26D771|nr:uncharacterized protein LOC6638936 isoform X1 [Drosophila willistoni]
MYKQWQINSLSLLLWLAALLHVAALQQQQQQHLPPATTPPTAAATQTIYIRLLNATTKNADAAAAAAVDSTFIDNMDNNMDSAASASASAAASFEQQQQQPLQFAQITALDKEVVERLIKQWAPIVWLAPEEKFLPLGVEEFLQHVHPMDKERDPSSPGIQFRDFSTKSHLVTNSEVQDLLENEQSFIYGRNPNEKPVPIYGVVNLCPTKANKDLPPPLPPLPTMASTRGPYIPVSIDPLDERNETLRRSSRLYPLFQRVKRQAPPNLDLVMGETEGKPNQPPPKTADVGLLGMVGGEQLDQMENALPPINNFIANLKDNVKFSGGPENNLEDNTISETASQEEQEEEIKGHLPSFHVTYWMFYPYSQGKTMCTLSLGPLGRIPFPAVYGYCLGNRKDIGSHVGDWEHMSLYFNGNAEPQAMYVSAHDAGAYYSYNRLTGSFEFRRQETRKGILQRPNFPKTVTTFKNHPVLFAAKGSHGLWTAPGKHRFVKVARLYDINGFGTPWNTWKAVDISYENLRSYGRSLVPDWLTYRGKWGNPKSKCHPFRRIGLNFCEFTDGPTGIPLKEPHFQCGNDYR